MPLQTPLLITAKSGLINFFNQKTCKHRFVPCEFIVPVSFPLVNADDDSTGKPATVEAWLQSVLGIPLGDHRLPVVCGFPDATIALPWMTRSRVTEILW